jgi:hypothetical protein
MTVTIIQGLWKEGNKKKKFIVKMLVATRLWKEGNQKKIIVKVLVITWRFEISDCVLSPQAYLH